MKGVVLRANADVVVESLAEPILSADECLIEVSTAGVCSSDVARSFFNGAYFYPLIMGHELAGVVSAVGNQVSDVFPGDRVTVFPLMPCFSCNSCLSAKYSQCHDYRYYGSRNHGGFAERLAVKAWNVLKVPLGVNLADAALTEPTAVVLHAINRLKGLDSFPAEGHCQLAVIGGGFLGLLAIEILHILHPNVQVTVIDGNSYKLELAESAGASTVKLRSNGESEPDITNLVSGYPWVLEASGTPEGFRLAINMAARSGRVCLMGNISGDLVIPQKEVSNILRRELTLVGTWNSSYQGGNPSDWTVSLDLMRLGLQPSRFVSHLINLEDLPSALGSLADREKRRKGHFVKVMVENHLDRK